MKKEAYQTRIRNASEHRGIRGSVECRSGFRGLGRLAITPILRCGLLGLLLFLPARPALAQSGPIKHVVVVIDENTNFADAYNSGNMPYMTNLIDTQGALATLYYANTHPSIGNYFELTTGQILTNDDSQTPSSFPVSVDNVVRKLLAAGLTWKAYCESIPSVGYTGDDVYPYAVHHCALPYLTDVQENSTQVKNLVPFTQFTSDLNNNQLPSFSFVVPNMCDDAHDCSLSLADQWLETNIGPLFKSPTFNQDTLLIFLWDESGSDNTHGGGNVEWAVFGAGVKQGYKQSTTTVYQHQSTLRLILDKLGVSAFPGSAATAPDMTEFFTTTTAAPQITSAGTATGTVGAAFSYQITATNSPTSFNATGLPAGLTVNTSSGLISGTPTTAGTSSVSLSATNASGTGTDTLTLTINPARHHKH
jgi:acid phosphatase